MYTPHTNTHEPLTVAVEISGSIYCMDFLFIYVFGKCCIQLCIVIGRMDFGSIFLFIFVQYISSFSSSICLGLLFFYFPGSWQILWFFPLSLSLSRVMKYKKKVQTCVFRSTDVAIVTLMSRHNSTHVPYWRLLSRSISGLNQSTKFTMSSPSSLVHHQSLSWARCSFTLAPDLNSSLVGDTCNKLFLAYAHSFLLHLGLLAWEYHSCSPKIVEWFKSQWRHLKTNE